MPEPKTSRGETVERIRIFLASPGDLKPERDVAARLIRGHAGEPGRLQARFHGQVELTLTDWPMEPALNDRPVQATLPPPRDHDIVVAIFFSTMGSVSELEHFARGAL